MSSKNKYFVNALIKGNLFRDFPTVINVVNIHYLIGISRLCPRRSDNKSKNSCVTRSIRQGYMSRCLELKDKVVGYTDEEVQLPPLHPRCRCAIMHKEINESKLTNPHTGGNVDKENETFYRPTAKAGAFAHLKVPMQLKAVRQICRKYGVDTAGLRIYLEQILQE